jgi:hypothetical protein
VTLRGKQLIVGTDVGVFATNPKGKLEFSYLHGLPVVPVSTMNLKPDDPNLLVVATYGRGIWTYCFDQTFPGTTGGCPITPRPLPVKPPPAVGATLAGPFGFELGTEGWTTATNGLLGVTTWQHFPLGNASAASMAVAPTYTHDTTTTLASPVVTHPGGWAFAEFANKRNTEGGCSCDIMVVEWSSNGTDWRAAPWRWDADANDWSDATAFDGLNADYPAFTAEKVAFDAPAGPLQVRFRFTSDPLVQLEGTYVDDVKLVR